LALCSEERRLSRKERGVWRDDERAGQLVYDEPSIVFCWAERDTVNSDTLRALRGFLHRMGRETRQGAVGIAIDRDYFAISDYDE
jgi:hypothetical protein